MGQRTMIMDPVGELRHLRNERSDWLLTVLTGVLHTADIRLRATAGSWYYRLSSVC